VARCNLSVGVGLLKNADRHAVLDAAGEIQIFGLGIENAVLALKAEMKGDEGSVSDETRQRLEFRSGCIRQCRHSRLVVARCAEFGKGRGHNKRASGEKGPA